MVIVHACFEEEVEKICYLNGRYGDEFHQSYSECKAKLQSSLESKRDRNQEQGSEFSSLGGLIRV